MPASPDIRKAVDAFLNEPKTLIGVAVWQPVADGSKLICLRPVEWRGEISGQLQVKAYPRRQQPCFRIILLKDRAIWRVDYTFDDDAHLNSGDRPDDCPSGPIVGPHYHCWADNRRFARSNSLPVRLRNARLLPTSVRTFEQTIWWFCDHTNLAISTGDVPDLPKSDTLL